MSLHSIWKTLQLSEDYLTTTSLWLAEERNLHDSSLIFFRDAGKLLGLSIADYQLAHLAFFMSILGAERALKRHYQNEKTPFKEMLQQTVADGLVNDAIFERIDPFSKDLIRLVDKEHRKSSHSQKLVSLIPELRNRFFHGEYWQSPEFLPLTLQMRHITDALQTQDVLPLRRPSSRR